MIICKHETEMMTAAIQRCWYRSIHRILTETLWILSSPAVPVSQEEFQNADEISFWYVVSAFVQNKTGIPNAGWCICGNLTGHRKAHDYLLRIAIKHVYNRKSAGFHRKEDLWWYHNNHQCKMNACGLLVFHILLDIYQPSVDLFPALWQSDFY